jgi:hypothetical protein
MNLEVDRWVVGGVGVLGVHNRVVGWAKQRD